MASGVDVEFDGLVEEIEAHLSRYLQRSQEEYPPGSQADGVATAVVQRALASGDESNLQSLVKLCVFLVENLEDVAKTYDDFYSEQLNSLKDENAKLQSQLSTLEDENSDIREQLHRRAEEVKVKELALKSLQHRSKESLNSSFSEKPSFDKSLHAQKMRSVEFDEDVSVDDEEEVDDEVDEEKEQEAVELRDSRDTFDPLDSSAEAAIFNRELLKENTELQSRVTELLQENGHFRDLSSRLSAENGNFRTAVRELRFTVERLHQKLHADDLLNSQASDIFEQLMRDNSRLTQLANSTDRKAFADALAADETFDIVGDEEEIPDEQESPCRQCVKLKDAIKKLEEKHEEEAGRIGEIVTQNVCMKCELEEWKADMAEKVRQNVELNAQLETCQRLLNRLSPKQTPNARKVFGNTLIRK